MSKAEEQLISLQFIYALANLIQIEHDTYLDDLSGLPPQIRVMAKRIKSDAKTVINHVKQRVNVKDEDTVINYCLPFHESVKLLSCCSGEVIQEFLNDVNQKVEL